MRKTLLTILLTCSLVVPSVSSAQIDFNQIREILNSIQNQVLQIQRSLDNIQVMSNENTKIETQEQNTPVQENQVQNNQNNKQNQNQNKKYGPAGMPEAEA